MIAPRRSSSCQPRNAGSTLIIVLFAAAMLGLLMPSLLQSFTFKNRTQNDFRNSDGMEAVVGAVAARALSELRLLTIRYGAGPWPAIARYSVGNRRFFPKGDPGFVVEQYQFDGNRFVPPKFLAPESDPQVWIARFGTGIGGGVFALKVQMTVCRISLSGRVFPIPPPYNLGVAWDPLCPAAHIVQVNYTGLVPIGNL